MWLIRLSVRRPVLTTVITLILILLGTYSCLQMGVAFLPKMDIPVVMVRATYEGAGPAETESTLVKPFEDAVARVEGVKTIRGMARDGSGIIVIELENDVDNTQAAMDIATQVRALTLPDGAKDPSISKFDINARAFMTMVAISDLPTSRVRDITEEQVAKRLTQIFGMATAEVIGGLDRQIHVEVDPLSLKTHGLSITRLAEMIKRSNRNEPAGQIAAGSKEISLRFTGEVEAPSQLGNIPLTLASGSSIVLGDLAEIRDTVEEERRLSRFNGRPAVTLDLVARPNANVVALAGQVRRELAQIQPSLPEGMRLEIIFDNSAYINDAIRNVISDMLMATLLTALVLYVSLQRFGATLAAVLTLPTSLIATFIVQFLFGFTINMMSSIGLAISVGVLVDNAILVLENIYRYREMGFDAFESAERGAAEIAVAVLASVSTNLGVFIPIAFMGGMIGRMFNEFALTVVFTTLVSLYSAFSLTPMVTAYLGGRIGAPLPLFTRITTNWWQVFFEELKRLHVALCKKCIRHPIVTMLVVALLCWGAFRGLAFIGFEFMPREDEGRINIDVELSSTASLKNTDEVLREIEDYVKGFDYVRFYRSRVGGGRMSGTNAGAVYAYLTEDKKARPSVFEIVAEWRRHFASLPDADVAIASASSMGGGGNSKPVSVSIIGAETGELNRIAGEVMSAMRGTRGVMDVQSDWKMGREEVRFYPNYHRLGRLGLSFGEVATEVNGYLTGYEAGKYREAGEEYDILVKLPRSWAKSVQRMTGVPVWTPVGFLPLDDLMEVRPGLGPTAINREDRQRKVTVDANTGRGVSVGEIMRELQPKLDRIDLPSGYRLNYGGDIRSINENYGTMLTVLGLAVGITFLMVAGLLESWVFAIIVMATLPLSGMGIIPMMLVTNSNFSVFALLGIVMMVGITVNNAIVILDYAEMRRREGIHYRRAIVEACRTRFRPIFMATLTTLVALIPMMASSGEGSQLKGPMAVVMTGGLIGGGVLALYIIPMIYNIVWRLRTPAK
ncbi:MAG: efflux RND transporter permease subunit [Synergistaceae bacterium]|jgi:HAE1 family hydrophobic/amphiphilic exporter-1|nr:efflux RND transporter permease subunit [Synergistaceae bacterium]